jgi:hypothetical protein
LNREERAHVPHLRRIVESSGPRRWPDHKFYRPVREYAAEPGERHCQRRCASAGPGDRITVTTGWFNTPGGKFGTGQQQIVNLNLADTSTGGGGINEPGANNNGYSSAINVDAQNLFTGATAAGRVQDVFMAEWSEILMSLTSNWHSGDSSGEGLSQFTGIIRFQTGHYAYYGSFVANWLNGTGTTNQGTASPNAARSDWVNTTFTGVTYTGVFVHGDGDPVSFGCALAFIFYLYTQLSFSIDKIISAYAGTLTSAYNTLTGDPGNPFPFFMALIDNVFPPSATATIPGPVIDNPFPLGLLSFWCNSNTFSRDQAKDIVASQGGVVSNAFYLILEGFSIDSFNAHGVTVPTPTGGFASLSGIKVQPSPATPGRPVPARATPIFEDPGNTRMPQRIRFSFDIVFTDESAFPNPGQPPVTAVLNGTAQIGGANVSGATASAGFELLGGANPYFTNVDSSNAADLAYLSEDLRVFSVIAGQAPLPGSPAFTSNAYSSIQNFIGFLNGNPTYTQPSVTDPLDNLPGQNSFETADSSVTPTDGAGHTAYNFAIARVRLRGTALDQAANCRVFFRLFVAQSCDTDFQPSTTYKSTQGTSGKDAGHPVFPLPSAVTTDPSGQTLQTTPYFATDINGTHDYDGTNVNANIRSVQIPALQDQVWAYYGCFLDIYDAAGNANLGGTHHCIVAEIAYSDAPIPHGHGHRCRAQPAQLGPVGAAKPADHPVGEPQVPGDACRAPGLRHQAEQGADTPARTVDRLSRRANDRLGQDASWERGDDLLAGAELKQGPGAGPFDLRQPFAQRSQRSHHPVRDHARRHLHPHSPCAERELRRSANHRSAAHHRPWRAVRHHGAAGFQPARQLAAATPAAAAAHEPAIQAPVESREVRRGPSGDRGKTASGLQLAAGVRRIQRAHPGHQRQGHAAPGTGHAGHPQVAAGDEAAALPLATGVGALHRAGGRKGEGPALRSRPNPAVAGRLPRQGRPRPTGTPSGTWRGSRARPETRRRHRQDRWRVPRPLRRLRRLRSAHRTRRGASISGPRGRDRTPGPAGMA